MEEMSENRSSEKSSDVLNKGAIVFSEHQSLNPQVKPQFTAKVDSIYRGV
jgi:hypothetical protein